MNHYVNTLSFLTKKKGNYDNLHSLTLELQNLLFALTVGCDQLNRLTDTHRADKLFKQDLDQVKEVEVAEAFHAGE